MHSVAPSRMIGRTLSHYEILDRIGEGGMGVVYKARDTHLDRFVAIKILPADKVSDPDRRRRFVQEAKAASALNHPGIVTIHDIAEEHGVDFMAMELVAGRTLDRVIPRGGLRLRETLDYGVQIAEALAAAHAGGIVHRDLKPSNVMVTDHGQVKLLDFGLAKLVEQRPVQPEALTATSPAALTIDGAIVGTIAYMAPEQAEGKSADPRADVFSFGAVLYEMVTGERAFQGDTPLSTLTAVLREEPKPIDHLHGAPPPELERIITRCLRKDPDRRWQSIADVKVALRELKEESESGDVAVAVAAPVHASRRWVPLVAAAALLLAVAGTAAVVWLNRDVAPATPSRPGPAVPLTTYHGREQQPALSPDGNSVAFTWNGEAEDNWDIWVKLIGPGSPLRLTSDPAMDLGPAWSPDGRSIAFVRIRGDRLTVFVVPALGGPEREVVETRSGVLGYGQNLSWSPDSRILVLAASPQTGVDEVLIAVDVASGETRPILTPPARMAYTMPAVSPDGKAIAFVRRSGVLTGELYVQRISDGFTPVGEPRLLDGLGRLYFGLTWSADGSAVIASWGNTGDIGVWRIPLEHPDRPERISPPGEDWRQPSMSLRQGRLAVGRATWDENLWRVELSGPGQAAGPPVNLSGSTRSELNAQFSPDGSRIAFESLRSGTQEVWIADADGRNARQLTTFNGAFGGTPAWSADGQSIAFDVRGSDGKGDVFIVPVRGGGPVRLTTDPADDIVPSWSHDGRWIYFESTRTGRPEIWKVSARGGDPVQITLGRATYAKESVDGRYLYYCRSANGVRSLRRIGTSGGEDVEIVHEIAHYSNFAVAKDGVYYEESPPSSHVGTTVAVCAVRPRRHDKFSQLRPGQQGQHRVETEPVRRPRPRRVARWADAPLRTNGRLRRGPAADRERSLSSTGGTPHLLVHRTPDAVAERIR